MRRGWRYRHSLLVTADALVLRYYSDLRVEDVAEVLGCPVGTAKSLIHRGLEKLKELLGEH